MRCPHCKGEEFFSSRHQLPPTIRRMGRPEWMRVDRQHTMLVCTHCSAVQWFAAAPERIDPNLPE